VALTRRAGRSRLTLALLILTSITILTLDFRDSRLVRNARDVASGVLSPARGAVDTVTEPITDAWNGATSYGDLEAENERLRERIAELEGAEYLDKGAAAELDALLDQLEIEWIGDLTPARARVVSGPISNFDNTIEIDKGESHGIKEGMPVVAGDGLVGRIVQTTSNRSTIQVLTDKDFRVGVSIEDTLALATARGAGRGENMRVDSQLDDEVDLDRGTMLRTHGADNSVFPRDIPVARIVRKDESAGSGQNAWFEAAPLVDVDELAYVTVLLWEPAP
jgi:rod shape-determining protein MreC